MGNSALGDERRTKKAKSLMETRVSHHQHGLAREEKILQHTGEPRPPVIQQQGTTMWSEVQPWTGLRTPPAQWEQRRSFHWMRSGYHNAQRAFSPVE